MTLVDFPLSGVKNFFFRSAHRGECPCEGNNRKRVKNTFDHFPEKKFVQWIFHYRVKIFFFARLTGASARSKEIIGNALKTRIDHFSEKNLVNGFSTIGSQKFFFSPGAPGRVPDRRKSTDELGKALGSHFTKKNFTGSRKILGGGEKFSPRPKNFKFCGTLHGELKIGKSAKPSKT
jgi:hypothetical protein